MKSKTPIALVVTVLITFSTVAAQTRDTWRSVRTNNLHVIGNADPEKLRQVAVWLEFFHGTFGRLVSRNVIESSVPTTVVVFRDDASFTPFKPLYRGQPANVAGYFLPGDDMNYIAISLDPSDPDPFSTAFHEYVHLHTRDTVPGAPIWLHEGLAELYGYMKFSGNDALLGAPVSHYLHLLRAVELLPLKTLFSVRTDSPHYNEMDKSGIFYGQSWALAHYLLLGERDRQDLFKRFLQQVGRGDDPAKTIESIYGITLEKLEQDLRAYVRRGNLTAQVITGVANPETYNAYTATQRSSLTESEALYYLADLSLRTGRHNQAEQSFKQAIAMDPSFIPAYASLGVVYARQRRYAEAKKYLQKATSAPQSYMVHYLYAYVLSREGISAEGRISGYSPENAAAMREQLLQSIKLAPQYAPAHYLLAVVDLFSDRADEALEMAQKAHQLSPSNADYAELVEDIKQFRSGNRTAGQSREPINSATIAEPERATTSRMLGGESGPVAINDGRAVDSSGSLPTINEVLDKYVQAVGGAATLNAVKSRVVNGTVDIVGVSRGGSFESYTVAPDKALNILQAHPLGKVTIGYNGRIGWSQTGASVRTLKGAELESVQGEADFYAILRLKSIYKKFTLLGKSKIGYREVYVLDMQLPSGPADRLFLDAATYLPVRMNTFFRRGVSIPVDIYFDDWREVDGIKVPHVLTHTIANRTLTLTVKEIKTNVPVDVKIFERPL